MLCLKYTARIIMQLSESIESSAYSSLFAVHDSQEAKDAWDTARNTVCVVYSMREIGLLLPCQPIIYCYK